jgi:phage terminase large subunit-like protein
MARFSELEEQMTSFTGDSKQSSPDRLDALVWGLTHLSEKNTEIFVSMI